MILAIIASVFGAIAFILLAPLPSRLTWKEFKELEQPSAKYTNPERSKS